jgi:type I restriction enzyme S subunit
VSTSNLARNTPQWASGFAANRKFIALGNLVRLRNEKNDPIRVSQVLSLTAARGVIRYEDKGAIGNNASEDISRYSIVRVGDIVVNSMNVIIGSVGLSKYDGVLSPVYYVLTPFENGLIDMRYLAYHFEIESFQKSLIKIGYGILDHRMKIPWINLRAEKIAVPPIEEQRRIADYLDEEKIQMDKILSAREKQKESLSSLLHSQIDYDLRDQALEIDEMRLSLLLDRISTGTTPDSSIDDSDGLPWYSPASISGLGKLGEQVRNISSTFLGDIRWVRFPKDSVLIVGVGGTSGRVSYLDHAASGNQQLTCLTPNNRIIPKFLFYYLMSKKSELLALANYTTLPILNNDFLKSLLIPTPSLALQGELVERWTKLENSANELGSQISAFRDLHLEYLGSLITAAVTGQFDVTTGRSVA